MSGTATDGLELVVEIGCEEIPARFIHGALRDLEAAARDSLGANRLAHGEIVTGGTPRRLALCVKGVAAVQPEVVREVTGPARAVAYDSGGSLTAAGQGFARSQKVAPEDLTVKTLPKGEYVCAVRREEGRSAAAVLAEEVPRWITSLRFPKSMRWGDGEVRFVRPLHWFLALLDGAVIPFEIEGIASGDRSRGHRFLAPEPFAVSGWEDYLSRCREASVIVITAERTAGIERQIDEAARGAGGRIGADPGLLATVANLVELPTAVCGAFEEDFLSLPPEVLVTAMKTHQKYFTVVDGAGRLLPRFVAVSNMRADDMEMIRVGNERVLRARLADARFFFEEDLKTPLGDLAPQLDSVVYQQKLGSYAAKMARVAGLARGLARETGAADEEDADRAARLCKADLVTQMVGEFPELQGVMGREYALRSGEREAVADAIREHYLPRFAGDDLPASPLGAILSVADRVDTIVSIFGIGRAPTGSEDPYALRRHTLAVINILAAGGLDADLDRLLERSICGLQGTVTRSSVELDREVKEFFHGRLEHLHTGAGASHDVVRAVLAAGFSRLPEVGRKIDALESRRREADFEALAVTFRRVANIVPEGFAGAVDPALFAEPGERALAEGIDGVRGRVETAVAGGDWAGALDALASLRPAVDAFFDAVLVMADDEALKKNRLALLAGLSSLFSSLADFRQMSV